jgi:Bacterial Ig-like domain (group 3)/FG-GAP-like repeat
VRRVLRLAIWLTIVFCPLQQTAAQAFKSAKLIPLPTGAGYVLSADFNGDGIPDLVYAPATGSDISPKILLGNGDGSFGNPISTSLPAGYYGYFAIADVNNDGKPDLLVLASNLGIPLLEVLLGNGDGTFQAPISSTLPTGHGSNNPNYTEHMGIADFNGDGNLDLVLPDSSNPYTSILLGDGHGHFAVKSTFLDENRPGAVQVGDFNKDGKMDFVSYFAQSRTAAVYLGQGDGTFKPPTVYSGTNNIQTLVVKDINGDGNLDLVTIDLSDSLQILLGNGDGTFTQTSLGSEVPGGPFAYILDVQDFNHDGILDIAIASQNGMGIFLGQPALSFAPVHEFPLAPFHYNAAIADFNKDGQEDFAVATPDGIGFLFGNPDGKFQSADAYKFPYSVAGAAEADFNADGIPDLIISAVNGYPQILQGVGDGTFTLLPDQTVSTDPNLNNYQGSLSIGDFNADHKPDLLFSPSNGYIALGKGNGNFSEPVSLPLGLTLNEGAGAYDLNGDGRTDVVLCNSSVFIFISQPDGSFTSNTVGLPGFAVRTPVFGDFNGDGKVDIAVSGSVYQGLAVAILLGNGDGTFNVGQTYVRPLSEETSSIAVLDMDHDGKLDIVVPGDPNSPSFEILYGNGDGTFQPPVVYPTSRPVVSLAAADLNEDSLGDMMISDGNILTVLYGSGNRKFGPEKQFLAGEGACTPLIGDLNGDGAPDLVCATSSIAAVLLNFGPTKGQLTVAPSPTVYGQPITLTATFTPTVTGAGIPSGSVSFSIDNSALGSAPLLNGVATAADNQLLSVGNHPVTATWPGDTTFFPHNLTAQTQVNLATPTIIVSISPTVAVIGQMVAITATLTPPYQGVPTGTLQLLSGATSVKSVTLGSSGQLTYSLDTSSLPVGSYPYSSTYSGDQNFSPASSATTQLKITDFTISVSPSSITLPSTANSVSVTVASSSGFNGSVDLSCTGLPAGNACSFSPPNISLANAASAMSTLTISTSAQAISAPFSFTTTPHMMPRLLVVALSSVICILLFLGAAQGSRPVFRRILLASSIVFLSSNYLGACGGGGGNGGGGGGGQITPYTVQVQASVHGASPAIVRSTTFTLNIQH